MDSGVLLWHIDSFSVACGDHGHDDGDDAMRWHT